ncbi:MAG: DUF58 domain-containing protein [Phycisphaerales bacterium]
MGAVNSQNNLLYWAFGAAVCGVVISGIISGGTMLALRVSRDPVGTPHVGDTLSIGYALQNRHRLLPVFAVLIEELGAEASGRPKLERFDTKPAVLAHCSPRGSARAQANLIARKRGTTELRYIRVSSSFPFGLVRKSVVFESPASVLSLPAVVGTRGLDRRVRTRSVRTSSGTRATSPEGVEFYSIAEYTPGDALVKIAWKRSAALGQLVVRRTASSLPARPWLVLADELADAPEREFETAVCAAASIAAHLAKQGAAVGLAAPWAGVAVPPAPGQRSLHRLYKALASLEPDATPSRGQRGPGAGEETITIGISGRTGRERVNALATESWLAPDAQLPRELMPEGAAS